jgi:hypothetical protein
VNWLLLYEARRQKAERPSDPNRLRVVPIILNVKNFDLFHIDRLSKRYNREKHLAAWNELGVQEPTPFQNVTFYAAQQAGGALPVATGRTEGVRPYSWSSRDIIAQGLLLYLFAESDAQVANDGSVTRSLRDGRPATFQDLLAWLRQQIQLPDGQRVLSNHHLGTWRKLHRRLIKMLYESQGVLRRDDVQGNPLNLVQADTIDPIVVDLAALAGQPDLQRFVVATILRQIVAARTGTNAVAGLVYLITLDELNRFAPRGATDPITQLIETVAAEMRSQGIILLGAQQQASKVSEKVIENCAIRVLGRSGTLELSAPVWRFLSESARSKAASLPLEEKLIIQDNFREPMHVRVPFPAWAMNPREARSDTTGDSSGGKADSLDDLIEE